ncbi:DUF4255 domain-containing protein [Dorea sp. D27]|uniref:DUF4255 domain-containing protein n=1 Tax=Dorea sp. D27 TaxID=658665 RepID=UPI00067342F5|nr:DUF4255 domain-containing protein [Dorea sp. D27]KMZ53600.1 hypothetical protein HMPREF0980_02469 [Dorea sp. D27]
MGAFTAIAKVSESMMDSLKEQLVPELIRFPGQIVLCSPAQRENASLGIFLYDIQESEAVRPQTMIDISADRQQYPPVCLSLYYMITAYSDGDVRFRSVQEERILGRIIQYFHDYSFILPGDNMTRIELQRVSTEDKLKLWSFPEEPFKVSLFYKVSPVAIDSALTKEVTRVRERRVNMKRM